MEPTLITSVQRALRLVGRQLGPKAAADPAVKALQIGSAHV